MQVTKAALRETARINEARAQRGLKARPVRAVVVGFPNVGKSALINRLLGRRLCESAARPGVTRTLKWLRIGGLLDLLDSPGTAGRLLDVLHSPECNSTLKLPVPLSSIFMIGRQRVTMTCPRSTCPCLRAHAWKQQVMVDPADRPCDCSSARLSLAHNQASQQLHAATRV